MDFKVEGLQNIFYGEIIKFDKNNNLILKIDEKEYELKLINFKSNLLEFIFNNTFYEISVLDSNSTDLKILLNGGSSSGLSSQNSISSQIPGRVISLTINKGDSVKKGDNIVVLESMKMQIAIKSHRDGVIKELRVKEGQSISRHDIVAILE